MRCDDVGVAWQQQHVALADQLLGAGLVEDDPAVGEAVDREGGARRDVGLDDAGDDVDRWPLRGHDEVHANCTSLLGDARDALLHIAGSDHHQVVELVDDDHDVGQPLERSLGARIWLQFTAVVRRVVAGDVAETDLEQQVVSSLHLLDGPAQRVGGLLGIRHRLGEQMWQAVVLAHLHLLRVDEDEPHLVGCAAHQDGGEDAVEAAALTRAGGTGDQQVRCRRRG